MTPYEVFEGSAHNYIAGHQDGPMMSHYNKRKHSLEKFLSGKPIKEDGAVDMPSIGTQVKESQDNLVSNTETKQEQKLVGDIPSMEEQAPMPVILPGMINLHIKPENVPVTLTYTSKDNVSFTVKFIAITYSKTEDSISFILNSNITLLPPPLEPLRLIVRDETFSVCYAGSSCTFDKLKFLSFVIMSNTPQEDTKNIN